MTSLYVSGVSEPVIARAMIDAVLANAATPAISVSLIPPDRGQAGAETSGGLMALGQNATAVIGSDDGPVRTSAGNTVTFGLTRSADIRATELHASLAGTEFLLHLDGKTTVVRLRLIGEHMVSHALAAIAVGQALALPVSEVLEVLEAIRTIGPGRMRVSDRPDGVTVIDDSAEANPRSMAGALKTLAQICGDRRSVAVLGAVEFDGSAADMADVYDRIGRLVVRLNVKQLIVIGQEARHIHNAAGLEGSWDGESLLVDSPDEAYDLLSEMLSERDVVLVKASENTGLQDLAARVAGDKQCSHF